MSLKNLTPTHSVPAATVIVLVVCSSLVFLPGGLFRFAWIKLVFALLACGAAVCTRASGRLPRQLQIIVLAGAGSFLLCSVLSPDPLVALAGRWPRYEGLVVLLAYVGCMWAGARILPGHRNNHRTLGTVASAAALIVAVPAVVELMGLRPLGGGPFDRPGGLLGNATDEGAIGAMLFALLFPGAVRGRRALLWAGVGAAVVTTIASGSRAAYAGAAIGFAVVVCSSWRSWSKTARRNVVVGCLLVLAAVAVGLALPAARARLLDALTVDGRLLLWRESLRLVADHLLAGVGPSQFVDALPAYHDLNWATSAGTAFPPDAPHMWILQMATMGGMIMLVPVLTAAGFALAYGIRNTTTASPGAMRDDAVSLLAPVCAYGAVLLTAFTTPGTAPLAFFLVGGLVGRHVVSRKPKAARKAPSSEAVPPWTAKVSRAGVAILVGAGLVQAVPAAIAEWPMRFGTDLIAQGRIGQADQQFKTAAALRPWDPDTPMLAAQAFAAAASEGNNAAGQESVTWAKKSLALYPRSLEAQLALAVGQNAIGQSEQARNILDSAIRAAPFNSELYMQRAISQISLHEPLAAIADAQRAAGLNPRAAEPWNLLADIYSTTGQSDEAQTARQNASARQ